MSNGRPGTSEAFALTSDPAAYVPSPERERALEQMVAALEAGAIPCLEGPTGIGKTLLIQLLVQRVADRFEPVYMPYPMLSTPELCQFALGLLERSYSGDPETALLQLASERAARRRPLLLLIDDASSLPSDSARGLAALRTQSRGALHLGFAGIGGRALLDAMAPFGDTLLRVALDEGISEAGLRDYVVAQLEHAGVSPNLRAAFDDEALDALAREASGNPRRLHLAAQTILRRAEGRPPSGSTPPPAPVEVAPPRPAVVAPPPPAIEPTPPSSAPAIEVAPPPPIDATPPPRVEALEPAIRREAEPEPIDTDPVISILAAQTEASAPSPPAEPPRPAAAPPRVVSAPVAPPPPAAREEEPIGEYRIVRRRPPEPPAAAPPTPAAARPVATAPPRRHEIETAPLEAKTPHESEALPLARPPARSEPIVAATPEPPQSDAALPRPPGETPPATRPPRAKRPVPQRRTSERTPSFPLVIGVAILSALLGFAVASRLQLMTRAAEAPTRPAASEPARAPVAPPAPVPESPPTPSARLEEPSSPPPAAEAPAPEVEVAPTPAAPAPAAPVTPAPAPEPQPTAAAPAPLAPPAPRIEVSINATPWAVIEVDGRELGETPLGGIALERGMHRFVARFPNGRVVERSVEVDASHRALVFE